MKKIFAICGTLLCLGLAQGAQAAEETAKQAPKQVGVYVAPKFIYGYTVMDKLKAGMHTTDQAGVSSFVGSIGHSENDDVFGGALAIGYDFNKRFNVPVRAELEYSIVSEAEGSVSTNLKLPGGASAPLTLKQQLDIQTLFVNVYYDINTGTPLTPYLGAGIGLAFIDADSDLPGSVSAGGRTLQIDNRGGSNSQTNFAWNVGAGAAWAFTDNLSVDLGYRFVALGEAKSGTIASTTPAYTDTAYTSSKTEDLYMHQVMLGLRYTF